MRSVLTSLIALIALFAALGLWLAGLDHAALFAILVALAQFGAEVFGRE